MALYRYLIGQSHYGRARSLHVLIVTTLLFLFCTACATMPEASNAHSLGLLTPGVLTVASDITNPPQEFIDEKMQQASGFDIDLITRMAQRLDLKVVILNTKIDILLSDLINRRFDVAISAIPIIPDRQLDFIPYFKGGQSILVPSGNPAHITNLADLCGQSVGVQDGTLASLDLQNASSTCQQTGKAAINITSLKDQNAVIQLLLHQRVAATYQDAAVSDYYIHLHPGKMSIGGALLRPAIEGIAVRKENRALFSALQTAFDSLKTAGIYHSLLAKWGLIHEEIALLERRTLLKIGG